jgi:hypothetical protein
MLLGAVDVTSSDITRQQRREIAFSPEVNDQDYLIQSWRLSGNFEQEHHFSATPLLPKELGGRLAVFFVAPDIFAI